MPQKRKKQDRVTRRKANRSLPAELRFTAASVSLEAAAENEVPSFEMVAYSGGVLRVAGFPHPVVVDLKGVEVNANAVALLDHKPSQRVGHFESLEVQGDKIVARGRISAASPHAEEVVDSARRGYRWQASIGARVIRASVIPAGKTVAVNGRYFQGPLIVAHQSRLNEVSFVGSGGDEDNRVSIAAEYAGEDEMTFSQWLAAQGIVENGLADAVLTALRAAFDTQDNDETPEGDPSGKTVTAAAVTPAEDTVKAIRAQAAAERERIVAVSTALNGHADLQAQAIREGWDASRAELEAVRRERDVLLAQAAPHGRSTTRPQNESEVIEAALCRAVGLPDATLEAQFSEQTLDQATQRQYRRVSLQSLMDSTIRAAGLHCEPGHYDSEKIRTFFEAEQKVRWDIRAHGNSFSTISTTGILSNTANKMLLQAFNSVAGVAMSLSARRPVSDFKTHTAYRMTGDGEFTEVAPTGELKHISLQEDSYTNKAKTYGAMLSLSRYDIINDDLGAFAQIPTILGRKAALHFEKSWFKLLLANSGPIFAAPANLITGGSSNLQISSLSSVEQLFLDQVDKDGDPILLTPATLLVPTALKTLANQLMTETRVNETTTANVPKAANNPHAGKWDVKVSPYLNGQGLSGQSATAWYMFANPSDLALFTVSLLNGRDTPVIESSDLDFNVLGMQFRAVFDFGIDLNDKKAAVKSNGA